MRKMGIGLGVGINRSNYAQGIFGAYATRVVADGGVVEGGACVDAVSSLLQSASLLLIPSGYKGGKLYSEIPTNGNGDLTWTRGSDAFRTNASGLIQRVPWNLASYSEQFDNASWLKSYATVTANSTTAPDGNTTADKIVGVGNNPLIYQSTSTLTGKYTFSIYGKKGELSWLRLTNGTAGTNAVWFDLNNGAVGTIVGAGNSANITSVGNGWYRCEFIINSFDSSQPTDLVIACTNADNTTTGYTGNSVDGLFIWGAQLVEGTTAQTYLPTTDRLNFPRLSYMYGSCPAVLLEPQRTNLVTWSNDFTNAVWVKDNSGATNPVVTANYATSPDGSNNASRLQLNKTGGVFSRIKQSVTTSGVYTFTVWMKSNTGASQNVGLRLEGTGINCVVTTSWQRFQVTTTVAISAESQILLYDLISGNDETADILIYGAQTELGAYPTTYIPTTSATATRVADTATKTGISSLIGQTEGTLFFEFDIYGDQSTGRNIGFVSDGTTNNQVGFFFFNNLLTSRIRSNATSIFDLNKSSVSSGRHKVAVAYKSGDSAFYFDGALVSTSTATFTFSASVGQIDIGANVSGIGQLGEGIYKTAVFQTRLTNSQLASLTTL